MYFKFQETGGAYNYYRLCIQGELIFDLYIESCTPYTKGEYKCQNTRDVCHHKKKRDC